MLEDVGQSRVQIIVVYKIDRLTRSLTDFAKLVEIFDTHQVTFVSFTQQFNTTTSLGRLTLNVLLSFAQYEREITGERIRDKFAASKAKGMFMGGKVPVGYRLGQRELLIDEIYAQVITQIFEAYLKLGSASKVKTYLQELNIRTPPREHRNGKTSGGKFFTTGHFYHILSNPIYIGQVRHHGKIYDGQHEAILSQSLWDKVQTRLAENAARPKGITAQRKLQYPLVGKIFSSSGHRLAPTTVHKPTKANQKNYYRHYTVSGTRRPPYSLLNMQFDNVNNNRQFLLSMYENVQNLIQGQSLSVKDAFELKGLLKSATSWVYRHCPTRAGLKDLEVAPNPTPTVPLISGHEICKKYA